MSPAAPAGNAAGYKHTDAVNTLKTALLSSPIYDFTMSSSSIVSVAPGSVVTSLTLDARHLNRSGKLHGAVSATIVDFVTGLVICSLDGRQSTGVSVDMHVSFVSTACAGDEVTIEAVADKVGGNMAFVTVKIYKGEKLVTSATHTKFVRGTEPKTTDN